MYRRAVHANLLRSFLFGQTDRLVQGHHRVACDVGIAALDGLRAGCVRDGTPLKTCIGDSDALA